MGILSADNAEIAMDALREILRSGVVDLAIVDSIGGMANQKEIDDSLADANMALLARLLSKALKQFTTILERNKCTLLVINQIRSKPGVLYGSPDTPSGGNALKFFSHIIAKVSKIKPIEVGKKAKGIITKIKVTKNKCAPPFREKEIHIMFPYNDNGTIKAGIDILQDLVPEAIIQGVIFQKGPMYTWRDITIKSKDKVIEHFKNNPPLLELLREDLLNHNDNTTSEETNLQQEDDNDSEFSED